MSANKKLTWRHLIALNQIYLEGFTKLRIREHVYIEHLIRTKRLLKPKTGNSKLLEAQAGFKNFYEAEFKESFILYKDFFQRNQLEHDARREYDEDDIRTLMFIADQKENLISNLTTVRTFSSAVFKGKGSKYLENHESLKTAVCKILGIIDFPDKDPKNLQWRLVVDCLNPDIIVLCENLAHLKSSSKARSCNVELWYVGGNNIGIIDHIGPQKLIKPFFYSCDWDYHGLKIFSAVKRKMALKNIKVSILAPYNIEDALPVDSPYHESEWNHEVMFSGLDLNDFDLKEIELINRLIESDKWIEEESYDLVELLQQREIIHRTSHIGTE
jgi:hypothetical protein